MKTIFVEGISKENDKPCAREITTSSCAQNARHEIKIPLIHSQTTLFARKVAVLAGYSKTLQKNICSAYANFIHVFRKMKRHFLTTMHKRRIFQHQRYRM